jgi:hypothetical protein
MAMLATERDQKLIKLLGDYELFSTRQILETIFPQIEKRTALRRLRKLEKEKWIRRAPGLPAGEAVWALGPVGAHKLKLDSYLEKINRNTVEHDVALNDIRMEFERMGLATDWITEQAMRRKQDKRHGLPIGHDINSDAIFVVDVANEPKAVALEVELHGKNSARYRKIFRTYADFRKIWAIWYGVTDQKLGAKVAKEWASLGGVWPRPEFYWFLISEVFDHSKPLRLRGINGDRLIKRPDASQQKPAHPHAHTVGA